MVVRIPLTSAGEVRRILKRRRRRLPSLGGFDSTLSPLCCLLVLSFLLILTFFSCLSPTLSLPLPLPSTHPFDSDGATPALHRSHDHPYPFDWRMHGEDERGQGKRKKEKDGQSASGLVEYSPEEAKLSSNPAKAYISFEVCEGLTNQRIALIHGFMIAAIMGRTALLPKLQSSFDTSVTKEVDFSTFYNADETIRKLEEWVQIDKGEEKSRFANENIDYISLNRKPMDMDFFLSQNLKTLSSNKSRHLIKFDCTIFAVDMTDSPYLIDLYWKIDKALTFSDEILRQANSIISYIKGNDNEKVFTALHVRIEKDWELHCQQWESITDGIIRDNCMTYTDKLHNVLMLENVPANQPLYIATGFSKDEISGNSIFKQLSETYNIVTKDMIDSNIFLKYDLKKDREFLAAVDYAVCWMSNTFIGNSVSTFSAMILLSRKHQPNSNDEKISFHYNAGKIPLEEMIPIVRGIVKPKPLKWIFAYNGDTSAYDYMLKAAVASALIKTELTPICLYSGREGPMSEWMTSLGVKIIYHTPQWKQSLIDVSKSLEANSEFSPLYKSVESMVGTFMRIDIPILGFLDDYVFYTDVDVFFRGDVSLETFPYLPEYYLVGTETGGAETSVQNIRYGNAGVMLINLQSMRRSYKSFLEWCFSTENLGNGLFFDIYGPGDQGAYNKYFQGKFDVEPWPIFNWKPYWHFNPAAKVIHFHGPKPLDYLAFWETNDVLQRLFYTILNGCKFDDPTAGCPIYVKEFAEIGNFVKTDTVPAFENQIAPINKYELNSKRLVIYAYSGQPETKGQFSLFLERGLAQRFSGSDFIFVSPQATPEPELISQFPNVIWLELSANDTSDECWEMESWRFGLERFRTSKDESTYKYFIFVSDRAAGPSISNKIGYKPNQDISLFHWTETFESIAFEGPIGCDENGFLKLNSLWGFSRDNLLQALTSDYFSCKVDSSTASIHLNNAVVHRIMTSLGEHNESFRSDICSYQDRYISTNSKPSILRVVDEYRWKASLSKLTKKTKFTEDLYFVEKVVYLAANTKLLVDNMLDVGFKRTNIKPSEFLNGPSIRSFVSLPSAIRNPLDNIDFQLNLAIWVVCVVFQLVLHGMKASNFVLKILYAHFSNDILQLNIKS